MGKPCNMVLAGIGGYGNIYLGVLLNWHQEGRLVLTGLIDPRTEGCEYLPKIAELGIPIYPTAGEFYRNRQADIMIVSTPVHYHADLTCEALRHGSHVLCEKPLASSMEDVLRMEEAQRGSAAQVAVGFQWSFTKILQQCKSDILAGRFGRPLKAKALAIIPRTREYFSRNQWAGRIRSDDGLAVMDSPVNNAHAHYLHNLFYLTGPTRQTGSTPVSVQAELYRAYRIENYDTAALRCQTAEGAEILFYSSHAHNHTIGPRFEIQFENAVITGTTGRRCSLQARLDDGQTIDYGELCEYPDAEYWDKIWHLNEKRLDGEPVVCGLAAARTQVMCTIAAQQSPEAIVDIDPQYIDLKSAGKTQLVIRNLNRIFEKCYERECLPSEIREQSILACPNRVVELDAGLRDAVSH